MTVAILVVTYLVTVVIPKFALLYRDMNVELPTATKILIAITVDYRPYILGIITVLLFLGMVLFFWSRTEEGGEAFDRLKFRLPLIGDTSLKFQVAQFWRTLSTLLTGGTPLVAALQTAGDAIDSPFAARFHYAARRKWFAKATRSTPRSPLPGSCLSWLWT